MSKILPLSDMLAACRDSDNPELTRAAEEVEAAGTRLAEALARHFNIEMNDASFSHDCGFCASFSPTTPDQECPDEIDNGDPSGEWEYREPLSCAPGA